MYMGHSKCLRGLEETATVKVFFVFLHVSMFWQKNTRTFHKSATNAFTKPQTLIPMEQNFIWQACGYIQIHLFNRFVLQKKLTLAYLFR